MPIPILQTQLTTLYLMTIAHHQIHIQLQLNRKVNTKEINYQMEVLHLIDALERENIQDKHGLNLIIAMPRMLL